MPMSPVTFTGVAVIEFLGSEHVVTMAEPQSQELTVVPDRGDLRALIDGAVERAMSTGADVLTNAMNDLESDQTIFIIELKDRTVMREDLPEGAFH